VARQRAGRSGVDDDLEARAIAWVERGCMDQGIPVEISDPLTIAAVAEVLRQGRQKAVKRDSSKRL
jgi:hypothetical protein